MFNLKNKYYKELIIYSHKISEKSIENTSEMLIRVIEPDDFFNVLLSYIRKSLFSFAEIIILYDCFKDSRMISILPIDSIYYFGGNGSKYINKIDVLNYTPKYTIDNLYNLKYIFTNSYISLYGERYVQDNFTIVPVSQKFIPTPYELYNKGNSYTLYIAGRYYSQKNYRCEISMLRELILKFKRKHAYEGAVYNIYNKIIDEIIKDHKIDIIEAVPPKLSEDKDRFEFILKRLKERFTPINNTRYLNTKHNFQKMKNLNYNERIENVKNVFQLLKPVRGKTILILDDVITTNSTLFEIGSMLYKAGAKKVIFLVLGKTQLSDEKRNEFVFKKNLKLLLKNEHYPDENSFVFLNENEEFIPYLEVYDKWINSTEQEIKRGGENE